MKRVLAIVVVLTLAACNGRWPASMEDHPSGDLQEGARQPPTMAVPVGGVEIVEDREELDGLANPYRSDPRWVERGAHLFAYHCVSCHGPDGRGGGKVSGQFPPAPDLRHVSICDRTDGFLYGTLTAGGRAMPTLREGLTSRERWALVSFVRKLQEEGCTGSREGMEREERE